MVSLTDEMGRYRGCKTRHRGRGRVKLRPLRRRSRGERAPVKLGVGRKRKWPPETLCRRSRRGVQYMLATFIQQFINGLMLGGSYALIAIGYTLIFGVLNLLHLAHGEVAMIGSYVGLTLVIIAMSQVGVLPLWLVLIAAMIGAGIVGIIVELIAFRPLGRRQLHITPLITTIAVAFV